MLNTDVEYMDKLELDNDLAMHFSMNPDIKPGSRLFYAHYLSENAKPFETRVHYYLVTEMTEEPCCSWNWTIGPVRAKSFKGTSKNRYFCQASLNMKKPLRGGVTRIFECINNQIIM
jgi:hypothetical protein